MPQVDTELGGDGLVTFWLDNPGKLNALDGAMLAMLTQGILRHGAGGECRLIAIRGRNGTFCAGRDVSNLQHHEGAGAPDAMAQVAPARQLAEALLQCPVPTVAVVSGRAVGLGMGMVAWCDFAIAQAGATFSVPEARLGIPPSMIALSLVRSLGPRDAAELVLRGRTITAAHAHRIGLLQAVCDDEAALARELADIASDVLRCSPVALRAGKALMREVADQPFAAAFEQATRVAAASLGSPDATEGMEAFRSKRPPRWAVRTQGG
jgi:methylglutaconyl-CoA hydratase